MPHFTNDLAYDAALQFVIDNCNLMVATAGEPTTFANANTNNGTGSGQKISQVAMAPADFAIANGDVSGRKVTAAAKASQAVVAAGDASYVAYLDTTNSRILHYYQLATIRAGLTTADTVNFPTHDLEILDTVAE